MPQELDADDEHSYVHTLCPRGHHVVQVLDRYAPLRQFYRCGAQVEPTAGGLSWCWSSAIRVKQYAEVDAALRLGGPSAALEVLHDLTNGTAFMGEGSWADQTWRK